MIAIGVDLGGTNVRIAQVDLSAGRLLDERRAIIGSRDPVAVAELLAALVGEVRSKPDVPIGVGIAGMLRGWSGVVALAPNLGWREVDFRALLRDRLGAKVELYNDLNAIAFGETSFGAARGVRDVLCIFIGTGIGAGLVADGKLYIGASHLAGEFGHMKVVRGGRRCGCGACGCIEAYASGANLATRARQELGAGQTSSALELAGSLDRLHAGHLDQAAQEGDPYAVHLWAEVAPLLGLSLANAVTLLNPARVVLGGTVWEGAPRLRELAVEAYLDTVNEPSSEAATLVDTVLGDAAGVIGAAALVAAQ